MKRIILRSLLALVLVLVAAIGGASLWVTHLLSKQWSVPLPNVKAASRPEAVARGAAIFHTQCEACHRSNKSDRASGTALEDAPAFLGKFHSANITRDPVNGIGALTDGEVARQIRFGVNHEGRLTIMPSSGMSDDDLAAVLGFLRSDDPLFASDSSPRVAQKPTIAGKLILWTAGAINIPKRPATGIVAPPKAATAAYGKYLAHELYDCAGCHTAGFDPKKIDGKGAFAGGFEFQDAQGKPIYSANLTMHESGLGKWTVADFRRAVREGIRPDGTVARYPMLRYRGLDDVDAAAIFAYLGTLPKVASVKPRVQQAAAVASTTDDPAKEFQRLGCSSCHAPGALYHEKLANAKGKSVEQVARWIRNPERYRPGTPMPTYEGLIDEQKARAMAKWVQSL